MKVKRINIIALTFLLAIFLVACSRKDSNPSIPGNKVSPTEAAINDDSIIDANTEVDRNIEAYSETRSEELPTIDTLQLGRDYSDIKANLKFLTNRGDIVKTKLAGYVKDFRKLYPNINIAYEALTDYTDEIQARLTDRNWGDICLIPTSFPESELPTVFASFGSTEAVGVNYNFLNNYSYHGQVYGIPSIVNVQGIVYNRKVFADAGITELPKTPDDFLTDLQKIRSNTNVIPLYTNFSAAWPMGAWDAYIGGTATGDPDFMNNTIVHMKNPFSQRADMTGPYAVFYVLYEAVARGLVEADPMATDWDNSKAMMNKGKIGTMVLGSWAITQIQNAGSNRDDIGYMPFPITVDGKQYASVTTDYNYGINIYSTDDYKIAAMLFIKYLTEQSGYAFSEGGIPIVKGAEYPPALSSFTGVTLLVDNPPPFGEETYLSELNAESELGINSDNIHVQTILESALNKSETLDDIIGSWNREWSNAQDALHIAVK